MYVSIITTTHLLRVMHNCITEIVILSVSTALAILITYNTFHITLNESHWEGSHSFLFYYPLICNGSTLSPVSTAAAIVLGVSHT